MRAAVDACREAGVEAVAVCLLFGFLHPEHEQKVGEALREALPGVQIPLSSEVLPEFRETSVVHHRLQQLTPPLGLAPTWNASPARWRRSVFRAPW